MDDTTSQIVESAVQEERLRCIELFEAMAKAVGIKKPPGWEHIRKAHLMGANLIKLRGGMLLTEEPPLPRDTSDTEVDDE